MIAQFDGLKIGLLTASASRLGGGVFEAVVKQADLIRARGGSPRIFALADRHSEDDASRFGDCPVTTCPVAGPAQIGFAPSLLPRLLNSGIDLLHLHGIWMYPSRAGAVWAKRTGKPYIVSPHGMLDPWITARGRGKKALARLGYERKSWRRARALHALTAREAEDIARESGRCDSIVIPNAGPPATIARDAMPEPHFVYLGRIHPKKNLSALVEAWRAHAQFLTEAGARLTIAGWGEDADVADLRAALRDAPEHLRFVGPVFGAAKEDLLRGAHHLVLPSHSEGLPMVVLEGWAAGTPTLMTPECNLPEGFETGAAVNCGYDADSIGRALREAVALDPGAWAKRSGAALDLARTRFSASNVAAQWGEAYAGLMARDRAS